MRPWDPITRPRRGETLAVCTMEKANITINRLMAEGRLGAPGGCARACNTRWAHQRLIAPGYRSHQAYEQCAP